MSLAIELSELTQQLAENLPAEKLAVFNDHLERLAEFKLEQTSLKVGDKAPTFTLPNTFGKSVSLESLLETGPVVINFYRGAWCPFCNLQLRALQKHLAEFEEVGNAKLIAISPQKPDSSLDTAEKNALTFEVLSDVGNVVARSFGLVFQVEPAFRELQAMLGVNLADYNGDQTYELPAPATFIVGTDRKILYASVQSNWTKRAEPSEVIDALRKLPITC